jgi:hypothetical protein
MGLFNAALVSLFTPANFKTTKELAASAWETALATQDAWIYVGAGGAPAFANSWVNYAAAGYPNASYYKDALGNVHLRGMIKSGTMQQAAFTLPAGYRPETNLSLPGTSYIGGADAAGGFVLESGGALKPWVGTNTYFSFHVTFRAA